MPATKSFELDFGGVTVRVTITDNADGTLTFDVAVTEGIADLRGLFFDLTDESLTSGLIATGSDVTDQQFAADAVLDLGDGANMNGSDAEGNPTPAFDGGVEIGTSGASPDDIQSTSFTLSHTTEDLTLDDIDIARIGIRLTSVGDSREGSLKLQVPPVIEIGGQKINDLDGDGVIDAGVDLGIEGWGISLYLDEDGDGEADAGEIVASTTTDADGFYLFTDLNPGDYLVVEEDRSGWTATTPMLIELDGITSGDTSFGNDFLNFDLFDISGTKYSDANGNGAFDTGEQGLAGVTIYVDLNGNDVFDSADEPWTVTGSNGIWSITDLGPDALGMDVREVVPSGYLQTGAESHTLASTSQDQSGLDFFNFKLPDDPGGEGEGRGNTPGFWKNHIAIFEQETGRSGDDLYEDVFGVELKFDGKGGERKQKYPDDPSLAEALAAKGGGEGALLRASTAALANAASDDVNYKYGDSDSLVIGVGEATGIDPDSDPAAFVAAFMDIFETLELIDRDDDGFVDEGEVILAMQDVYDDIGADDAFDFGDANDVAKAFDAMNNMPSVETADFLV